MSDDVDQSEWAILLFALKDAEVALEHAKAVEDRHPGEFHVVAGLLAGVRELRRQMVAAAPEGTIP
jgi:hypothetical protein